MTNDRILEILMKVEKNVIDNNSAIATITLNDAIAEIKNDIRKDIQKQKGCAKQDKLVSAVLKNAPTQKPILKKYYQPVEDVIYGHQFGFTDGYRAYILNNDFGYDNAAKHPEDGMSFNLNDCLPKKNPPIKLTIDLIDLQLFLKQDKADKKISGRKEYKPYIIENDAIRIGFNPQYLLEFCQMFDTDTIYASGPKSLAYFANDKGERGCVLPIRLDK